jgi:hypothetical protein
MTAPGKALVLHATARPVRHLPHLHGLGSRRRIAVECTCQPGTALGVAGLGPDDWDGQKVWDLMQDHIEAVAHRQDNAAGYTRSVLEVAK